jgi:hypothetical protein
MNNSTKKGRGMNKLVQTILVGTLLAAGAKGTRFDFAVVYDKQ